MVRRTVVWLLYHYFYFYQGQGHLSVETRMEAAPKERKKYVGDTVLTTMEKVCKAP